MRLSKFKEELECIILHKKIDIVRLNLELSRTLQNKKCESNNMYKIHKKTSSI